MDAAILVVVGAVASVVAAVTLQTPLQWLLARALGGLGPIRGESVKGIWISAYAVVSDGERIETTQVMKVRQFGPLVTGRCLASSNEQRHFISARLSGRNLTGRWFSDRSIRASHYGAFQVVLRPDGQVLVGKWVGFDRASQVQQGDWIWTLQRPRLRGAEGEELLKAALKANS